VITIPMQADVYAIEVATVDRSIIAGQRSPSVMSWDESLANMRTLDRWRAAIGLRYKNDECV
jgi:hypothetical protein